MFSMVNRKMISTWAAATFSLGLCANISYAAEGASSNYFPGAYGSLLPGVAPEPVPVLANVNLFYNGSTDFAVRQGRIDTSINADAFYSLAQGLYVWDAPEIGGRFAIGGYVPYGHSTVDGDLTTRLGTFPFKEDQSGLGDVGIIPASFYWSNDNFHFNLYELIIAPTGVYNVGENVFVGRNYWSFDTILAATWFDPEKGTELSAIGGIMFNTENKATNYRTGTEFHLDLIANQFLSEEFAVGLRGYIYQQLTGDSGSGALLGDFKGESVGAGVGLSWIPKAAGGKFSVTASWVRDLYVRRRLEADYATVALALTF
jgi:hypothetical protein